jgi:predicted enzyme related to lactoylglutathione lyase
MNSIAFFEIQSTEPAREAAFYTAVFGWVCTLNPHAPIEYYRVQSSNMAGGILKRPAPAPAPAMGTGAFTCSIEVADFDATAAVIIQHGGAVALPKFAIPGRCWQGYFLDPDQNVFGIFQVDISAA